MLLRFFEPPGHEKEVLRILFRYMATGNKLYRKIQRETDELAGKNKKNHEDDHEDDHDHDNDYDHDKHDDVLGCAGLAVQPPWAV